MPTGAYNPVHSLNHACPGLIESVVVPLADHSCQSVHPV